MFKESDFEWLSIIECLKKAGMPIKKIRDFIDWCLQGDDTIDQRLDLIKEQKEKVEEQMEQLRKTMEMLNIKNGIMKLQKKQAHVKFMIQ